MVSWIALGGILSITGSFFQIMYTLNMLKMTLQMCHERDIFSGIWGSKMFPLQIPGISLPMRSQLSLLLIKISYLLFKRMILWLQSAHLRLLERLTLKQNVHWDSSTFCFYDLGCKGRKVSTVVLLKRELKGHRELSDLKNSFKSHLAQKPVQKGRNSSTPDLDVDPIKFPQHWKQADVWDPLL